MNAIKNKNIAIIGGGPGGLTLARLLQLKGADVKVYERDQSPHTRVQGATLDLHEDSGLLALQHAGLIDGFKANYRPGADKVRVMDNAANILADDHATGHSDRSRPEIDRGPLRKILLDALFPDTVIWDSHFDALQVSDKGGYNIKFKNGTTVYADLVIAADGANSKVRQYITPIKPFYVGMTALEGTVYDAATKAPKISALLKGGKIFAVGDSQSLIVSSKGDGSLQFYLGFNTSEQWWQQSGLDANDNGQMLAWFKKEFAGWADVWHELIENASGPFVPRPQYCMPADQKWKALANLTMIGDAAHLMPPYAGEGVNMAMLDALELSLCLTDDRYSDTHTAIATYEEQMRIRAAATIEMTLRSTEMLHSPGAMQFLLDIVA